MIIVPAAGPQPCEVLICGEAPGKTEAEKGRPFAGKSGDEQEAYLARHGLSARRWRMTNVVSEYREGNPDPSAEQIAEWTPVLLDEIAKCNPRLIVAVGRFAARFFLGDETELEAVHGLPHRAGAFDSTRANRAPQGCVVLPIYHPAAALYEDSESAEADKGKLDKRSLVAWDYERVADTYKAIKAGRTIEFREDKLEGREVYRDVSGRELADYLAATKPDMVSLDTEGTVIDPWSLQVSDTPGIGFLLRTERDDFSAGLNAIRQLIARGVTFAGSNIIMHDIEVCRAMGLDLSIAQFFDTQYGAYILCLEPQGLKPLVWRWCSMRMLSHEETVGVLGIERQVDYLNQILARTWPKPEPQVIVENDGTSRLYKPASINKRVEKILLDVYSGKIDKDGNHTDPLKRWKKIDKVLRRPIEAELGEIPIGSMRALAAKDFGAALYYSCRDADGGVRLQPKLSAEHRRLGLEQLMADGMETLPAFAEMQATGMPASRKAFENLAGEMQERMWSLQSHISHSYYGGKPFNPGSDDQFATLVRRRGLRGEKRTKGGKMSVSKQSIEHLRYEDEAVESVLQWREHQHTLNAFCDPILEIIPEDRDIDTVHCQLLATRTTTRRLASKNPNLLAQPKHSVYGQKVRDCYICPEGQVFAEFDLSQIEVRMLAHESADPLLCDIFNSRRDIHKETAMRIFGVTADSITQIQRFFAKRVTFGIAYGVSGQGLATQIRTMPDVDTKAWDDRTCDKLIREWLKLYKGAAQYFSDVEQEVTSKDMRVKRRYSQGPGVVKDCWGMMRYLPAVWSRNPKLAAEARRQAINHRIQGGAQGLLQKSIAYLRPTIRNLQQAGLNVHWTLQIHDSIILRIDEELYDVIAEIVIDAMTNHCGMTLRVPVLAEGKQSRTWGGL